MSEIRYSKFDDKYVIIAPERFHKPANIKTVEDEDDIKECPFCPDKEGKTPKEIFSFRDKNDKWITRVIPNLYTALNLETKFQSKREGVFESFGGFGIHEIIIDTPKHIKIFDFDEKDYFYLLKTIRVRIEDLKKDSRIKYLSIFKNYGFKAGASQSHPHTQIIGMPLLSVEKKRFLYREYEYYKIHGRKLLRDIVDEELNEDKRILYKSRNFISFLPYASVFPFEVMVVSLDDSYSYLNLNDARFEELSVILDKSLKLLKNEIGDFDFNIEFFEPPINKNFDSEDFFDEIDRFHLFYIRIRPRIFNLAGFEIMNEMTINPVDPDFIKKVLDELIY